MSSVSFQCDDRKGNISLMPESLDRIYVTILNKSQLDPRRFKANKRKT